MGETKKETKCINCPKTEGLADINVCGKHNFYMCEDCLSHFIDFLQNTENLLRDNHKEVVE